MAGRPDEVAVLAPTGKDGCLAERILGKWGLRAAAYADMESLCVALRRGVGAAVLAEEALRTASRQRLLDELAAQPSWSDVPLIVLTAEGELSRVIADGVEAVARRGNVTLLERPIRVATLVTVVRSALRARERQYEVRDHIAERAATEAILEAARAEAEAANLAKNEFLTVMSHELRTPLNAIAGYAELIELGVYGPVTSEQRDALARMQKSQRHLLGLINGVLNYARLESGKVEYEVTNVLVDDVLATAEALVAPQARAHGLRLNYSGCDPALTARGDQEKIRQVVLNILSNAIKFTAPGGSVWMTCDAAERAITIRVGDTGRGIAAEKREAIFQPFVQVDARLSRTQEGIGLGLAISRDLARGMGGDLTVESEIGRGSTFSFSLPRGE